MQPTEFDSPITAAYEYLFAMPEDATGRYAVAENEHNLYCERSKNIYKVSSIKTMGVHQICDDAYFSKLKTITNLKMYHFYKWSSKLRVIENCTNVIDFSFQSPSP